MFQPYQGTTSVVPSDGLESWGLAPAAIAFAKYEKQFAGAQNPLS
jgi:hypothetical protein